jgi:hypothetical protein
MWRILEFIVLAAIVLISITEFFYPLLMRKPLFGSFRKLQPSENNPLKDDKLEDKISSAKKKVEEVKSVQNEVEEHFKLAEDLKNEADDLLK